MPDEGTMLRCRRLRLAFASFGALLGAGCFGDPDLPTACRDCNVVLISVDTLRADHVGALGYGRPTTPNIDALAARGVLFENAIAQSSWTRPSHMSILTGLHPREHGFVALADRRPLEASIPTLPGVLREHGYTTAAFVGGVNLSASVGFDRGFDVFRNNGKYFRDNLEDARWWLDRNQGKKFFLFFHGYDAHTPYQNDPVDRQALRLPAARPTVSHAATCRAEGPLSRVDPFVDEYDAAVHRADRYVGKMLAELEQRGLADRTIVLLLSDHGEEFLEHGRCFHLATLYREVLHVPLLFLAPGLAPRRVAQLVSAGVSIAPSVMDLLGIREHPFPAPSLLRRDGPDPIDVISETERGASHRGEGHLFALTTPVDKLIHWTTGDRFGWFNFATDAVEQRPVADSPRQKELAARLDAWTASHPPRGATRRRPAAAATAPGSGTAGNGSPDTESEEDGESTDREERLRSLGYAE